MPTSSKDEEMLTMNKALMDLIMDGRGPDGSGWVVFGFFSWAGAEEYGGTVKDVV